MAEGRIVHSKKYSGPYFFIQDDSGTEYYANVAAMVNRKQYDKYCWVGNRAVFDIRPAEEEGRKASAINIVLDEVMDPEFAEKRRRHLEHKRNERANAAKKRLKQERMEQEEARRKEREMYKAEHMWYAVQQHINGVWINLMHDGKTLMFKTVPEGKACIAEMKGSSPWMHLRIKQIIV